MTTQHFEITGFGRFPGVSINPTEELVRKLQQDFATSAACSNLSLACEVLAVSATAVEALLKSVQIRSVPPTTAPAPVVWLHFGVDSQSDCFKLETTACNNATFRQPDMDGWSPWNECICSSQPFEATLTTALPTRLLTERLAAKGHLVKESDNAGRYICNYLYFTALQHTQNSSTDLSRRPKQHALFVHVPPASRCPAQKMLAFAVDLIREISALFGVEPSLNLQPAAVPVMVPEMPIAMSLASRPTLSGAKDHFVAS